jgi:hypothetical protein
MKNAAEIKDRMKQIAGDVITKGNEITRLQAMNKTIAKTRQIKFLEVVQANVAKIESLENEIREDVQLYEKLQRGN